MSSCAISVSWNSSNTTGTVTVQQPYIAPGHVFATGANGTQGATFTPPGTYKFELYDGTTKLNSANFTASCASGTTWNGSICVANASGNGASCAGLTAPISVVINSSFNASISVANTGITTWTSAAGYALGSQSPANNTTWNLRRIVVPQTTAPGATATFQGTFKAPGTAGTYPFAWQMLQPGVEWFGGVCSQNITVTSSTCVSNGCEANTCQGLVCNNGCVTNAPGTLSCPVQISISANPTRVRPGSSSTISWSASNATSCAVSGPGLSSTATSSSQSVLIEHQSTYTISCQPRDGGNAVSDSVTVNVIPVFQEF